ncbi:unnamed protein product [Lepidochelys olivacea]
MLALIIILSCGPPLQQTQKDYKNGQSVIAIEKFKDKEMQLRLHLATISVFYRVRLMKVWKTDVKTSEEIVGVQRGWKKDAWIISGTWTATEKLKIMKKKKGIVQDTDRTQRQMLDIAKKTKK